MSRFERSGEAASQVKLSGGETPWLRSHGGRIVAIAAAACVLAISVAQSNDLADFVAAMNVFVTQAGPVPGSLAEELPTNLDPAEANHFAFEGGQTGSVLDAEQNINTANLGSGGMDIPTGGKASPLFGAQAFSQKMLRFEEFAPLPMGPETASTEGTPFPAPVSADSGPTSSALDAFLSQYSTATEVNPYPYPTREANTTDLNPWQSSIESFLGRPLSSPPAEGRPPGEDWARQRYQEFYPKVYIATAQAGARTNTGLRDVGQDHGYTSGEFGHGGLNHNPVSNDLPFDGTAAGLEVRFHPNFPLQDPLSLWTFDGTFPPKLLQARYGEPIMMRHYNALPIDPAANMGFGLHTLTTHEHNGHNPAESDGYTQAFFFPGQYYDYHWPMVLAGHDSINTEATDPRAGTPDGNGGIRNLPGDWRETMSTHWFHDHMLDFTAQNVYKGNAAMMNYYSSLDRGNEGIDDGVNLRFPSGTALDWGNRDYDINLLLADKAWDQTGQLWFNIFNYDGFMGDQILTNWLWKPYMEVRARRYRFRILNGAVSRYFRIALVEEVAGPGGELAGEPGSGVTYNRVPFYMIANDGNIMEHAVYFDGNKTVGGLTNRKGILPTQGIAERYDIVVDFAQFAPGTKLYFVNLLEHETGRRPKQEIPLAEVLDGSYAPAVVGNRNVTDSGVTKFLEFRVQEYSGVDQSMNPADYVEGGLKMIPLPSFTEEELANALHRTFEFKRSSGTDRTPWTIKTDGKSAFSMDPRRLSAAPTESRVEIWHIEGNGGWSHPIHVHFEEGQIFKRGGVDPPEWERWARKDLYRIGRMEDSTDSVDIVIRFREFLGTYMEHCHNTQHEDHAMLLRWDVESPGQVRVMPTPMPTWDGVGYVPSFALPTFRAGDLTAAGDAAANPDFGFLTDPGAGVPAPGCGNGVLDPGEGCDDGNNLNFDGCSVLCTIEPVCGDAVLDPTEECDDGNLLAGDGCSPLCEFEICGNGVLDPGEQCDSGDPGVGGCSAICTFIMFCGDGTLDAGEECDDGNSINGDGCSAICQIEAPQPAFVVAIDRAMYRPLRDKWRVRGTSDAPVGSLIDIYIGSDTSGPLLASPAVLLDQSWDATVVGSGFVATAGSTVTAVPRAGGASDTASVAVGRGGR